MKACSKNIFYSTLPTSLKATPLFVLNPAISRLVHGSNFSTDPSNLLCIFLCVGELHFLSGSLVASRSAIEPVPSWLSHNMINLLM